MASSFLLYFSRWAFLTLATRGPQFPGSKDRDSSSAFVPSPSPAWSLFEVCPLWISGQFLSLQRCGLAACGREGCRLEMERSSHVIFMKQPGRPWKKDFIYFSSFCQVGDEYFRQIRSRASGRHGESLYPGPTAQVKQLSLRSDCSQVGRPAWDSSSGQPSLTAGVTMSGKRAEGMLKLKPINPPYLTVGTRGGCRLIKPSQFKHEQCFLVQYLCKSWLSTK